MSDKLIITFPPKPAPPPIYCGNGFAMQRADGLWECRVTTPPIYCGSTGVPVLRADGLWACVTTQAPMIGPVCTASIVYAQGEPSNVRIGAQETGLCDAGLEIALAAMLAALLKGP